MILSKNSGMLFSHRSLFGYTRKILILRITYLEMQYVCLSARFPEFTGQHSFRTSCRKRREKALLTSFLFLDFSFLPSVILPCSSTSICFCPGDCLSALRKCGLLLIVGCSYWMHSVDAKSTSALCCQIFLQWLICLHGESIPQTSIEPCLSDLGASSFILIQIFAMICTSLKQS